MTPSYSPPPEAFTCPICDRDISPERPPNLNLDNCSCGEQGTEPNNPESRTFVDLPKNLMAEAMIREAINNSTSNITSNTSVEENIVSDIEDYENEYSEVDEVEQKDQEPNDHTAPNNNNVPLYSPTLYNPCNGPFSFTMAEYLRATSPEERSYHESLNLPFPTFLQNMHHSPTLDLSILELIQPHVSASICATKASSSMRSSCSIESWGSQNRTRGSGDMVWMGGWMEESDLEMSWPPVLCGSWVTREEG